MCFRYKKLRVNFFLSDAEGTPRRRVVVPFLMPERDGRNHIDERTIIRSSSSATESLLSQTAFPLVTRSYRIDRVNIFFVRRGGHIASTFCGSFRSFCIAMPIRPSHIRNAFIRHMCPVAPYPISPSSEHTPSTAKVPSPLQTTKIPQIKRNSAHRSLPHVQRSAHALHNADLRVGAFRR